MTRLTQERSLDEWMPLCGNRILYLSIQIMAITAKVRGLVWLK
ncbi:hypothetical protein B6N60_00723 [Richelia sinica FACHB-800]|uniref:Uncharacterized protein n=1 Tax=Richelia sinica FACHB-800 TaxID=1357546 RepID=A0A975T5X8_9NOST|nr:hypothetical protein [Richelia sinica]QXE22043.1 hypothetical protein B6N60_00723 [Richelia sinica FACHB-800]